jgi:ribonuclease-3
MSYNNDIKKKTNNQNNNMTSQPPFIITPEIKKWIKNGDFKKHILNEKNISITEKFINKIFKTYNLDHKVKNLENFQQSMIHVSYLDKDAINEKTAKMLLDIEPIENPDEAMELQQACYDRFEFMGDRCIDFAVARYLFLRYPEADSGFLTVAKQKIVQKKSLSKLSKKMGLQKYAVIARNMELENARETNEALSEDIFESFMCALSFEISKDKFEEFIFNIIEKEIDIPSLMFNNDDYKSKLMNKFHELNWENPIYVEEYADNGSKIFKYSVKNINGKTLGSGKGKTKAIAQQAAAKKALVEIIENNEDNENDYYGELSE